MENVRAFPDQRIALDREHLSIWLAITLALVASGIITYSTGGTHRAFPHLFYIPVIISAYYFKVPGAITTGMIAGLICGPLMPLNTDTNEMQSVANWLMRTGFFMAVGTVAGTGFQVMGTRLRRQERLQEEAVLGFVRTIDAKSPFTAAHSQRVAAFAAAIGEELGLSASEVRDLYWAGLLHDVGKLWVDDHVLNKRGPLNKVEWESIRQHPVRSADFIGEISEFRKYHDAARHHHERYDGNGYPDGIAGTEIPFAARILAVADAFEAMTAERPYRPPLTFAEALDEIEHHAGTQFDPEVARAFVRVIRSRPLLNSTAVRWDDGRSNSMAG
jgi:hypothetical protein